MAAILPPGALCYHSANGREAVKEGGTGSRSFAEAMVFTGLVEALGKLERVDEEGAGRRLTVVWPGLREPLAIGESVAVNGCCLTVVEAAGERFVLQAGPETLVRTNLGEKRPGAPLNLERSLRAGDRLGGHFVQGHIDTTAALRDRRPEGEWDFLAFHIDPEWTPLMVPKGSLAVDGVSLTLVDVTADGFSVMLIPHTLAVTTLGTLRPGDRVNIETDILAKHVAKLVLKTDSPQRGQ
jgi:riboflavin synthase